MDGSDIVAIVAVLAGVATATISTWLNSRTTLKAAQLNKETTLESVKEDIGERARNQAKLQEQLRLDQDRNYLLSLMTILRKERSKLQFLQNKGRESQDITDLRQGVEWEREREEAYGLAYAAMLCLPDKTIRELAEKVMQSPDTPTSKLEAIDQGLIRLGVMLDELQSQRAKSK